MRFLFPVEKADSERADTLCPIKKKKKRKEMVPAKHPPEVIYPHDIGEHVDIILSNIVIPHYT